MIWRSMDWGCQVISCACSQEWRLPPKRYQIHDRKGSSSSWLQTRGLMHQQGMQLWDYLRSEKRVQAVVLGIAKSGSLFILYTAFPSYPFLARAAFVYWLRIGVVDIFILKYTFIKHLNFINPFLQKTINVMRFIYYFPLSLYFVRNFMDYFTGFLQKIWSLLIMRW